MTDKKQLQKELEYLQGLFDRIDEVWQDCAKYVDENGDILVSSSHAATISALLD